MQNDIWSGLDKLTGFERLLWGMFSYKGKMRRQGFWGYGILAAFILNFGLSFVLGLIFGTLLPEDQAFIAVNVLSIPLSLWVAFAAYTKRFRSMESSPWFSVLILIPLVNIGILIWVNVVAGKNHRDGTAEVFE